MRQYEYGVTVWFTGLSGAGKTTICKFVEKQLRIQGYRVEVLDGDAVRQNLCKGLGFSKEDREENIRRIGFVAHLLARNNVIVLVSAISPYREIREEVRQTIPYFIEVYVNASLEVCEQRDVKGLYKKQDPARSSTSLVLMILMKYHSVLKSNAKLTKKALPKVQLRS